jgi:hypothetical protein
MTTQFNPYSTYRAKFLHLLDSCRSEKNPALWLYENNARVTLFMLESIARIWCRTFNDEITHKWLKTFKKLEDLLGEIDNYDTFFKMLSKNKAVTKTQKEYFEKKRDKSLEKLNKTLLEKDFFKKFMIGCSKPGVLNFNAKNVLVKIEKEIKNEIAECGKFFANNADNFNDMELQVHELRRKLRWISIYAQSLRGIIILKEPYVNYNWEKEFVTESAKNSAYNKLPLKKGLKHYIIFNRKAFCALTFVIEELAKIKDKGLLIEALARAIDKTMPYRNSSALKSANKALKSDITVKQLLEKARKLLYKFFIANQTHMALVTAR